MKSKQVNFVDKSIFNLPTNSIGINFTFKDEGKIFGIEHDPLPINNLHCFEVGNFNVSKFRDFQILTIVDRNFKCQNVSLTKIKSFLRSIKDYLLKNQLYDVYFNELNIFKFNYAKFFDLVEETFNEPFWNIYCCFSNKNHNNEIANYDLSMPFIHISINNMLSTTALLDSGADCNLIDEDLIKNLDIEIFDLVYDINVVGLSGSIDIIGFVRLNAHIDKYSFLPDDFFVVRGGLLSSPILLGTPFLIKNSFNINFEFKTIHCKDNQLNWIDADTSVFIDDSEFNLKLPHDLFVGPRSGSCVSFPLPPLPKSITCCQIIEINKLIYDKNLIVLDSEIEAVLPIVNNCVNLEIRNYSNTRSKFTKDFPFATIKFIKEIPVVSKVHSNKFVFNSNVRNQNFDDLSDDLNMLIRNSSKSFKELILKNVDVFAKDDFDIGKINNYFHRIDLYDDIPINCKPFRTPHSKMQIIEDEINRLLKCKIIKESQSPYAAPCLIVYKKTGKPRLVIDFRKINKKIVPIQYPLPHLETSLQLLGGNTLFSTLDLISGYHQIPLRPEDCHKTAFTTGRGLYEFRRVPFGMVSSGAAMQIAIERVLSGLINKSCLVYVDDIIIMGRDEQEHDRNLDLVLSRLKDNGFKLNLKKCEFKKSEIECLGHVVSSEGISPNPSRINSLVNKKPPNNVKELRSFLGLASYYRRFVEGFAKIVYPLTQLLKKDIKFKWSDECHIAFEKITSCLVNAPILTYPDFSKTFYVTCDASKSGIGAVLTQIHDKKHMPIAFYSRALNNTESKYPIYDLEGLAIKAALNKFRFYVLGYPIVVRTDNKPALFLLKSNQCQGRLANYLASIMEYNPRFEHIPGNKNHFADFLSRNVNNFSKFNPSIPKSICNINSIKKSQLNDSVIQNYLNNSNKNKYLYILNDLIYYKNVNNDLKLFVPQHLKHDYFKYFHCILGCHEGVLRTFERVKRYLFIPNLYNEINNFVSNCTICKQAKPSHLSANVLGNFEASSRPFQRIHVDLLGPLPRSQRKFKYILVIVDSFSRYSIFKPIRNKNSKTVINHLRNEVIQKFTTPEMIVSDMGREFDSQLFKDFCKNNNINLHLCAPYMHQSNGLVERMNLQIENALRCLLLEFKGSWDKYLQTIQESLNSTVHSSIKYSPHEILNNVKSDVNLPAIFKYKQNLFQCKDDLFNYVKDKNLKVNKKIHDKSNKFKRNRCFKIGDVVYVKVQEQTNKLKPKFRGPFNVINVFPSKLSYLLEDERHNVVHAHINNIK